MELPGSDSEEQTARSSSGVLYGIEDDTREGEGWEIVDYRDVPEAEAEGSSESQLQAPTVQNTGDVAKGADSSGGCDSLSKDITISSKTIENCDEMVPGHDVEQQGSAAAVLEGMGVAHLTLIARASWRNAWANIYKWMDVIRKNVQDSGFRQLVDGFVSCLHSSWSLASQSMLLFQSKSSQLGQRCAATISKIGVLNVSLIIGCTGLCAVLYRSHKRNLLLQMKLERQDAMLVQTVSGS